MILALGYWILANIHQYWVALDDIFIGCHTQCRYCSDASGVANEELIMKNIRLCC